jgi:NitT/TauT family transport system substrate-binding protein
MNKNRIAIRLFFITTICSLVACSGAASTPAPQPLRVEWTLWQGDYTLLVAKQKGFFDKHGVNVEPIQYDSATRAIPDLAGAKIDGGIFTMGDVILTSTMTDVRGIMVSDNGGIYSVVTSSDIQSVKGLRDKRIGLNLHTSSEMFVSYMLKSVSMNSTNVKFVEMSPDQIAQNIPDQIDAGLVWEPYTTQALQRGEHVVYQSTNYSTLIPKLIVFRTAIIKQRPEDVQAFIQAWNEAVNFRINHPQESTDIISKATGLPADELTLTNSITIFTIDNNKKLFANNPGTDASSIYFIAGFNRDFLVTIGYITNPPDINSLLDPSFLK